MSTKELYDRIWAEKSPSTTSDFAAGSRSAVALAALPGGSILLDVGCGGGAFLLAARSRYDRVVGVDISPRALQVARSHGLDVVLGAADDVRLPFADGAFHSVVSLDVIEHVLEPDVFVRELTRVTAPGGWTILSTPNIRYLKHIATLVLGGRFPHTSNDEAGWDGGHLHYFTRRDLLALLSQAGARPAAAIGIIPSRRLAFLRRAASFTPVVEWLAAGLLVVGRRPAAPASAPPPPPG